MTTNFYSKRESILIDLQNISKTSNKRALQAMGYTLSTCLGPNLLAFGGPCVGAAPAPPPAPAPALTIDSITIDINQRNDVTANVSNLPYPAPNYKIVPTSTGEISVTPTSNTTIIIGEPVVLNKASDSIKWSNPFPDTNYLLIINDVSRAFSVPAYPISINPQQHNITGPINAGNFSNGGSNPPKVTVFLAGDMNNTPRDIYTRNAGILQTPDFSNLSIQYSSEERGKKSNGNTTMNLTASISTNADENVSLDFLGSNPAIYDTINNNTTKANYSPRNILSLSVNGTGDQYTDSGYLGFYAKTNGGNLKINLANIGPAPGGSPNLYNVSLTQNYYGVDGTTLKNTYTIPYDFYYDGFNSKPSITSATYTIQNRPVQISGINVIGMPNYIITLYIQDLGQYYYPSPVIEFSAGSNTDIGIPDIRFLSNDPNVTTSTPIVDNKIPNIYSLTTIPITASGNIPNVVFSNALNINTKANGLIQSSQLKIITPTNNVPYVVDVQSVAWIDNPTTNPPQIQNIDTIGVNYSGFRVYSGFSPPASFNLSNGAYIPPDFTYNRGSYSYSLLKYNHEWNITSQTARANVSDINGNSTQTTIDIDPSQELQLCNGLFQSRGINTIANGYLRYIDTESNRFDYSNPPSKTVPYRFATFVWKVSLDVNTVYNTMTFTFHDFFPTIIDKDDNGAICFNSDPGSVVQKLRMLINFRVESINNNTIVTNPPSVSNTNTTNWIDGNSSKGQQLDANNVMVYNNTLSISKTNYNNQQQNVVYAAPKSLTPSIVNKDLAISYQSFIFKRIPPTNTCYVYCRIGLPMINNIRFSYISLNIT